MNKKRGVTTLFQVMVAKTLLLIDDQILDLSLGRNGDVIRMKFGMRG